MKHREPIGQLLARLAAAGVAEPSTLVIECAGDPVVAGSAPCTAMSSRVSKPTIVGAEYHATGLGEGYCTYAIDWVAGRGPRAESPVLSEYERLALGLLEAVERVRAQGVPVRRFVLTGFTDAYGTISRDFAQAIADVLETRVSLRPCREVTQKGGEILRRLRQEAGRHASVSMAIKALTEIEGREQRIWRRLKRAREIATLTGRREV